MNIVISLNNIRSPAFSINSVDGKFQASAWGGNKHAAEIKCNGSTDNPPENQKWVIIGSSGASGLPINVPVKIATADRKFEWSAWGESKQAADIKLNGVADTKNQFWVIKPYSGNQNQYKIHSYGDENLVAAAWGGLSHSAAIKLNGNKDELNHLWTFKQH